MECYACMSFAIGALVGFTELLGRYRDEPFKAAMTWHGVVYAASNGLASLFAFWCLVIYGDEVFPSLRNDPLLMSLFSGFGAMLVMRSKLFSVRSNSGEELAMGPDVVVSTLLRTLDRSIDRQRSSDRVLIAWELTSPIQNAASAIEFIRISIASYQNLTDVEKQALRQVIDEVVSKGLPPRLQLVAVAFALLNISGEENFRHIIKYAHAHADNLPPPIAPLAPAPWWRRLLSWFGL